MNEIKFTRKDNPKYNSISITIEFASLTLKNNYMVHKIEKTGWNYRKCIVQLESSDLCEKVENWETKINEYLKNEGIEPVKILYNNKIYPKTLLYAAKNNNNSYIKIKGVWVNDQNKPFIQLWFE